MYISSSSSLLFVIRFGANCTTLLIYTPLLQGLQIFLSPATCRRLNSAAPGNCLVCLPVSDLLLSRDGSKYTYKHIDHTFSNAHTHLRYMYLLC